MADLGTTGASSGSRDGPSSSDGGVPLCVALGRPLVRTDLLAEQIGAMGRERWWRLFLLPFWLLGGRRRLERRLAGVAPLQAATLPFDEQTVEHLRSARAAGRSVILVAGPNASLADDVAGHVGVFSEVLRASPAREAERSPTSAALVERFGESAFDFVGGSPEALAVWPHARRALVVGPRSLRDAAAQVTEVEQSWEPPSRGLGAYIRAFRPHHWTKNLLVFVPLLAAHQFTDLAMVAKTVAAFVAFCLCASVSYLLNDLMDLPSDRKHPEKRHRPFASGDASPWAALLLPPVLLVAAFGLAVCLDPLFAPVLLAYLVLTTAYSVRIKQIVMADVIVLAGLYTVRIIGGGVAASVTLSFWLLAFSMFLFTSLAIVKRYSELLMRRGEAEEGLHGRGYRVIDLETLVALGVACGGLAVLVLALYVHSERILELYTRPVLVWLLCPLLLYWIGRVWIVARRGEMHHDPVVFALKDPVSRWVLLLAGLIVWLAV